MLERSKEIEDWKSLKNKIRKAMRWRVVKTRGGGKKEKCFYEEYKNTKRKLTETLRRGKRKKEAKNN